MNYKPMLAPNETVDLDTINYPILASYKLDGIRCIFYKGEMFSRSLKPIVNKQLRVKFEPIAEYSKENNLILDGEIYSPSLTFQKITKYCMTKDFADERSVKKHQGILDIPESLKFYCFDTVKNDNFDKPFAKRFTDIQELVCDFPEELIEEVQQYKLNNKEQVIRWFDFALEEGYEGLILKDRGGKYKCGRGTIKEGLIYKVKPYQTFDGEIIEVIQATKVDPNAEKKTNELGRSVTSKKKGDRILIEKACDFKVKYNGLDLKVVIAMTDKEKEEVWRNRERYIGRTIEYKGMMVGSKDLPRHPVFLRFIDKRSK